MRLLTGLEIQDTINHKVSTSKKLHAAVAYWSSDSSSITGITERVRTENIQLICDLGSGFCNPDEILTMKNRGIRINSLDNLHAKVWIFDDCTIIGSANASKSAFSLHRNSQMNNTEVCVITFDTKILKRANEWFTSTWEMSHVISDDEISQSRKAWNLNTKTRIRSPSSNEEWVKDAKHTLIYVVTKNQTIIDRGSIQEAAQWGWPLKPDKANQVDYVLATVNSQCIAVFEDCTWTFLCSKTYDSGAIRNFYQFKGTQLPPTHEVAMRYVGKYIPVSVRKPRASNPAGYDID